MKEEPKGSDNKNYVEFDYNDCHRCVEDFKIGGSKLTGLQTGGESRSGDLPAVRTFTLDKIQNLKMSNDPNLCK